MQSDVFVLLGDLFKVKLKSWKCKEEMLVLFPAPSVRSRRPSRQTNITHLRLPTGQKGFTNFIIFTF